MGEICDLHSLDRFEELAEKKEIIRKIVNIVHQTEFNLTSNADFLSISENSNCGARPSLSKDFHLVTGFIV